MADRCPVCDRPPGPPLPGMATRQSPITGTLEIDWAAKCDQETARATAAAADPSVCWGGKECAAHAVNLDWRSRALEAELRCDQMERELCEARADLAGVREYFGA